MVGRLLLVAAVVVAACASADAGILRHRHRAQVQSYSYQSHQTQGYSVAPGGGNTFTTMNETTVTATFAGASGTALDEVNAKRAARGLRPFIHDPALTEAAGRCAAFRAQHGLFGHTSNDFSFLPPGANASSAGCAAYPASYGWMSCCTYEGYTYAGAAYVTGRDGKRYMHLFVR